MTQPRENTSLTVLRWPLSGRVLLLFSTGLLLVSAGIGLMPILQVAHENWTERPGHFQHGYPVLAFAVWMALKTWRDNPPARFHAEWWALCPLVVLIGALIVLNALLVNTARLYLLPPLFIVTVTFVLGHVTARTFLWPALYVYLALPIWWSINGLLRSMTTRVVGWALDLTTIPALILGDLVQIPSGAFQIGAGCAGLGFFLIGLAGAAFYSRMYLEESRHKLVLLATAALLAISSNWIRVYLLVLIGHLSEMQHYVIAVEHDTFGWLVFIVLMSPVLVLARHLELREAFDRTSRHGSRLKKMNPSSVLVSKSIVPAALAAAMMLLLPRAFVGDISEVKFDIVGLPDSVAGYVASPHAMGPWQPVFLNAVSDRKDLVVNDVRIEVFRAVYPIQDRNRRMISGNNNFLGAGFGVAKRVRRDVETLDGPLAIQEHRGFLHGRERLVWSWYWVAGRPAASPVEAKLFELFGLLSGRRDSVAVALSMECEPSCDAARIQLKKFLVSAADHLSFDADDVEMGQHSN